MVLEGTSDVAFLEHAAGLHSRAFGGAILDADFAVVAAGFGDDGGVDGVNRRLNMMRQLADTDRDPSGAIVYRFIGLLDNDWAGRNALEAACKFDRRLCAYTDLILLHPVMPVLTAGAVNLETEMIQANRQFTKLNWEIEDLCSERLLAAFEVINPGAVTARRSAAGRTHREFDRKAKAELRRYFLREASLGDVREMLALLKALRSYVFLPYHFIQV
ncbi:hypothetical protein [Mesorhizobium sp. B2-1-3]|uniref:hypothetical protein n=1 Tax=Mesorhizobium sp. B2-1-3 TaxID=2589972 RepID=UPI001FEEF7D0|nr:hypothetical protein [Mesorhizobium sp. B2-1-3]